MAGLCAGSLAAILAEIEELKASADALESELSDASKAAEAAAKRSRRLAARSHELQVCVCNKWSASFASCVFLGGGLRVQGGGGMRCALRGQQSRRGSSQMQQEASSTLI